MSTKIKYPGCCHFVETVKDTEATFCKLMDLTNPGELWQRRVAGGGDTHFSALLQYPENAMVRVGETADAGSGRSQGKLSTHRILAGFSCLRANE